jgi:hypothetical protein
MIPRSLPRRARAVLLCLLAFVSAVQCGAALVRASAGPSHLHVAAPAAAEPVLHDVRRHPAAALLLASTAMETRAAARHGHAHAEKQRHHHAARDVGGEIVADAEVDRRDAADESGGSSGGGAASVFLPIPASASAWQGPEAMHGRSERALWVASGRAVAPAQPPPRHDAV